MGPREPQQFFGVATAGAQNEGDITNNDWHVFTTNQAIVARVLALTVEGRVLGWGRTPILNLLPAGEAVRHRDLDIVAADVERAAAIGCNAYRFSVEWSRVEPAKAPLVAADEPFAYTTSFPGQGHCARVLYRALDGRIHEIASVDPTVAWQDVDLTREAGGVVAAGEPFAYTTSFPGQGHCARVLYRALDGRIHEIASVDPTVAWQDVDLTREAGGVVAAGEPFAYTTSFPGQGHCARVLYRALDGRIHEIASVDPTVAWQDVDLTREAGGVVAAGEPFAYTTSFPGQGHCARVLYRALDGRIHEIASVDPTVAWQDVDLTREAGGVVAAGEPFAYTTSFPGQGHCARVLYRALDGRIHEIASVDPTVAWQDVDLTREAGGVVAAGEPFAYTTSFPGQGHCARVLYRALDGRIHEIASVDPTVAWQDVDLTREAGGVVAAGEPFAYTTSFPGQGHCARVLYRALDGRIHEIASVDPTVAWQDVDLSAVVLDNAATAALEAYYVPLLRLLRAQKLEPIITLSHFALPQWVLTPPEQLPPPLDPPVVPDDPEFMASLRGWENSETVDRFVAFVTRVVNRLKEEGVRYWITLNEPVGLVAAGYVGGVHPPGFTGKGDRAKAAYFNLLRAHVRAYDTIKRLQPEAQVSIAHNMMFFKRPHNPGLSGNHVAAGEQMKYFYNDHFLRSITSGTVDTDFDRNRAREDRRPAERSDEFFGIPAADWRPKLDFIGINYYRSVYPYHFVPVALSTDFVGGQFDLDMHLSPDPHHLLLDVGWEIYPEGLYLLLKELHAEYGLPILISENGAGEAEERYRTPYTVAHLEAIERARAEGVGVLGYLHWTLVDNWEWQFQYEPKSRFGLLRVDRDVADPTGRKRLPRRMTDAALALQYAASEGASAARDRFGSITPSGRFVVNPVKSPGALWRGAPPDGPELALYLAPVSGAARWLGMIFDYSARRWVRLDEIIWDRARRKLSLFHEAKANVPSRRYEATVRGNRLSGIFRERGRRRRWQVDRVLPHGVWTTDLPFGPVTLSAIGKWEDRAVREVEVWTGRVTTPSPGTIFDAVDHAVPVDVTWNGVTLMISGSIPHHTTLNLHPVRLSAGLTRTLMTGSVVEAGRYPGLTDGMTWHATRLDDGIPF